MFYSCLLKQVQLQYLIRSFTLIGIPGFSYSLDSKCWISVPCFCYALKNQTDCPGARILPKILPERWRFLAKPEGLVLATGRLVRLSLQNQKHGLTTFATSWDTIFFSSPRYSDGHRLEPCSCNWHGAACCCICLLLILLLHWLPGNR